MMREHANAAQLALQAILSNSLIAMNKSTAAALAKGTIDIVLIDYGIDSLGKLEMSIFLSEVLEKEVSETDLLEISTFSELTAFLSGRRAI